MKIKLLSGTLFNLCFLLLAMPGSLPAQINLSITVKDLDSGMSLQGANVYAHDRNNQRVFEGTTNSLGEFTIATNLAAGQWIRVKIKRDKYKSFEREYLIEDPKYDRNRWEIKLIPLEDPFAPGTPIPSATAPTDYDKPLSGHIYDGRARRKGQLLPIAGVKVDLQTEEGGRVISKGVTNESGHFLIYHDFKPGQSIMLFLEEQPDYLLTKYPYTYQEYGNILPDIFLFKRVKVPAEYWVMGGGLLVGAGGFLAYSHHQTLYDRYRDVVNLERHYTSAAEREKDYDNARLFKGIGIGGMAAGGAAILGGLSYHFLFKKKNHTPAQGSLSPDFYPYGAGMGMRVTF